MKNNKDFNFLFDLSKSTLGENRPEIKPIKFKQGEMILDKGSIPKGVIYIKSGFVREIFYDENREPFTTKIYEPGDYVGANNLLREEINVTLVASSNTKGDFIGASDFFRLIVTSPKILYFFSKVEVQELFYALNKSKKANDFSVKELFNLIKDAQINYKAINISNKPNKLTKLDGEYLVSGNADSIIEVGDIISYPLNIKLKSKLPLRLIPLKIDLNQKNTKKVFYEKENNLQDELISEIEAIEDWYGAKNNKQRFPDHRSKNPNDQIISSFRMITRYFDIPLRKDLLYKILNNSKDFQNLDSNKIAALFDLLGLNPSSLFPRNKEEFFRLPLPSVFIKNNKIMIIWAKKLNNFVIGDPEFGQYFLTYEEINNYIKENFQIISLDKTIYTPKSKFGFKWILPYIKKYKFSLIQVVVASFFVQLFALLNPLLIQQIIDAVISQGNYSTLNILGILLVTMAFAQALLTFLRTFLFTDTTNRIDSKLGSSIVRHLLRLPLQFFSKRSTGEISGRVGELEKIRSFLTGTALTVLLDSLFTIIYIAVLLNYSVNLTLWALGVLPFFISLTLFISPILRNQLRNKAEATAKVDSHLFESLSAIETIKGQNIELNSQWKWEKLYGKQVNAGYKNIITSTAASSLSNFLQQVSGLIIIWVGAGLVLQGKLTLGQLIAFRILSGYVTNPLLRLASLWQNFQEAAISMERLSDIIDNPQELEVTGKNLPPIGKIKGRIIYEGINFGFDKTKINQLININLKIEPYSFIGIVGSSGSGKSTLLKLLTRLYIPSSGFIKIDDKDVSTVDLYSLRKQIGVVPQSSLLFDGSILDNIAITKYSSEIDEIIHAAKISCADEFISKLPGGYNYIVGEKGVGLSGGEIQRIAIARAILKKPRILILDEATSALDSDTEKRLLNNIISNFKNSTIIFITHRLKNLKNADKIFLISHGTILEQGDHNELISMNGQYTAFFNDQENN